MASLSLKAANKQRKAAATNVINNAAAQAAWGAIGLMPVPSANIKRGHSNGNRRGVGASKSIISNSCMTGRYINVTACREHQVFLGQKIEELLKNKPNVKLYRCPDCKRGPYTYAGRISHKRSCTATDRALAKAIEKVPADAGAEMEERNNAIRTHPLSSRAKKRTKTSSNASAAGFNASATGDSNSTAAAADNMDLDGDAEYAVAGEPSVAYDEMFKAAAIKVAEKMDRSYRSRTAQTPASVPAAYAHNPMMATPHWANDITQVSRFVGPAFVYVWAPDLWWNRQGVPEALRLRPGVKNPEAQYMACPHGCGDHLVVKESWVARKVMGFGEDGAIVSKQMVCNTCHKRMMPWDPLLLETLQGF